MHSSRMGTAHSSSHLSGLETPPQVWTWRQPQVWPEDPPRCGPGDNQRCGPGDNPRCGPGDPQARPLNFPLGCGPGDLQGMLGYQSPGDLRGMLGYHLQCMLGYPPEQND